MSIFGWFSSKAKPTTDSAAYTGLPSAEAGALGGPDSLRPGSPTGSSLPGALNKSTDNAVLREQMRMSALARREHLYTLVRDTMDAEGISTASYKFKVLALDQGGRQYLVMIDLAAGLQKSTAQLTQIETNIAKAAKAKHDIVVLGSYWRINDQLTSQAAVKAPVAAPARPEPPAVAAPAVAKAPAAAVPAAVVPPAPEPAASAAAPSTPGYEPPQTEEMLAFKRALAATVAAPVVNTAPRPAPRSYSPLATGYEDTQVVSPETRPPGLGSTQYGQL